MSHPESGTTHAVPSRHVRLTSCETPGASWYRYLAGLVALWFVDTRKKDFVEMSLHHVVTILLLVLSYTASHMRVGAVVFVLHNLADPFLQSAKLCKVRTRDR
jgi:hypothetical protein